MRFGLVFLIIAAIAFASAARAGNQTSSFRATCLGKTLTASLDHEGDDVGFFAVQRFYWKESASLPRSWSDPTLSVDEANYIRARERLFAVDDLGVGRWYQNEVRLAADNLKWGLAKKWSAAWLRDYYKFTDGEATQKQIDALAHALYFGERDGMLPEYPRFLDWPAWKEEIPVPQGPTREEIEYLIRKSSEPPSRKSGLPDEPEFSQGCCQRWKNEKGCGLKCSLPAGIKKWNQSQTPLLERLLPSSGASGDLAPSQRLRYFYGQEAVPEVSGEDPPWWDAKLRPTPRDFPLSNHEPSDLDMLRFRVMSDRSPFLVDVRPDYLRDYLKAAAEARAKGELVSIEDQSVIHQFYSKRFSELADGLEKQDNHYLEGLTSKFYDFAKTLRTAAESGENALAERYATQLERFREMTAISVLDKVMKDLRAAQTYTTTGFLDAQYYSKTAKVERQGRGIGNRFRKKLIECTRCSDAIWVERCQAVLDAYPLPSEKNQ